MFSRVEKLDLTESYAFNVKTQVESHWYAAKLTLTPQGIRITIYGETNEKRNPKLSWWRVSKLICNDGNHSFALLNLRGIEGRDSTLSRFPEAVGFFEVSYEVGFLVFSPSSIQLQRVNAIGIQSGMLQNWIGNTVKQEAIIKQYYERTLFNEPKNNSEFFVELGNESILSIGYDISIHHMSPNFSAGVNFQPVLTLDYFNAFEVEGLLERYLHLYALLAFLHGSDFFVNTILLDGDFTGAGKRGSLYYPVQANSLTKVNVNYSFFPISRNLRFDTLGLPELPLDVFLTYFQLTESKSNLFSKYLKYKRLINPEEQFLGFFRLLETLTFKKKTYFDAANLDQLIKRSRSYLVRYFDDSKSVNSFLKALPRFNQSKYNTSKCIKEFMTKLSPEVISAWKFSGKDIDAICKLRNDISHANDYDVDEQNFFEIIKFIEVLLIYALFELVKIEFPEVDKIINRLNGYHLIVHRESPF